VNFETLRWEGGANGHCVILDQTKLPAQFEEMHIETAEEMWQAILQLSVRGAPAIGVAAAYGMVLGLARSKDGDLLKELERLRRYLDSSRPTAVNLSWATNEICLAAREAHQSGQDVLQTIFEKACQIHEDDKNRCRKIGEFGADLVPEGGLCLTHCNAGALATGGRGTALSVFYEAHEQGKKFRVFADETRPLLQGSRLTAWELSMRGLDVTVICDSMAGFLMQRQQVDLVVVGADRIAANGDTANKIGTYSLALLAREHQVPFYVAAPLSTFDFSLESGSEIPIEERQEEEIKKAFGFLTAPEKVSVWNPAFDVTPFSLIWGFITEKGLIRPSKEKGYVSCLKQGFQA
jgi:methylthioribose-1-phosphate isomerase